MVVVVAAAAARAVGSSGGGSGGVVDSGTGTRDVAYLFLAVILGSSHRSIVKHYQ